MLNVGFHSVRSEIKVSCGNEGEQHDEAEEGQGEKEVHTKGTDQKDEASEHPVMKSEIDWKLKPQMTLVR